MVYGGQRDGVRGRPVRKHRVYTGPRTVTGPSPTPRRVVECGGGCALVAYLSLGLELLGRVARISSRMHAKVTACTLVSFPPARRVFMARMFGCVRMRRRCVLLLACIAAVPACCMRLRTTYPRMSAGAGVTTRTPIVEYKQVTIASPSEGPPAQEITVVSTYMCRMHQ